MGNVLLLYYSTIIFWEDCHISHNRYRILNNNKPLFSENSSLKYIYQPLQYNQSVSDSFITSETLISLTC